MGMKGCEKMTNTLKLKAAIVGSGLNQEQVAESEIMIPKKQYIYSLTRTGMDFMEAVIGAKIIEERQGHK